MKIVRKLDTVNAKYDLLELTKEEFSLIYQAYLKEAKIMNNGYPEHDELLKKFKEMINSDTLII